MDEKILRKKILEILKKQDSKHKEGGVVVGGQKTEFVGLQEGGKFAKEYKKLMKLISGAGFAEEFAKGVEDAVKDFMDRPVEEFVKDPFKRLGGSEKELIKDNRLLKLVREMIKKNNKKIKNKKLAVKAKRELKKLMDLKKFDIGEDMPVLQEELMDIMNLGEAGDREVEIIMETILSHKGAGKPKKEKKSNPWVDHVKKIAKEKGISYREAMKIGKESYKCCESPSKKPKTGVKAWHEHVKKIRAELPGVPYRDQLKVASVTWKKGGKIDIKYDLKEMMKQPGI